VLIRQRPAAPGGRRRRADLRIYRRSFLAFFKKLVVVLVLALVVVDDPEDLDEAEGGPKPPQGASWSGSTSAMARLATAVVAGRVGAPRCR
jgi:hypothetical protein